MKNHDLHPKGQHSGAYPPPAASGGRRSPCSTAPGHSRGCEPPAAGSPLPPLPPSLPFSLPPSLPNFQPAVDLVPCLQQHELMGAGCGCVKGRKRAVGVRMLFFFFCLSPPTTTTFRVHLNKNHRNLLRRFLIRADAEGSHNPYSAAEVWGKKWHFAPGSAQPGADCPRQREETPFIVVLHDRERTLNTPPPEQG